MIVVDPIPGQETRNSDYLLENGAGIKVNNLASLGLKVSTLLSKPARLNAIRTAAARLARPRAAEDIVEYCLNLLDVLKPQPVITSRSRRFWRARTMVVTPDSSGYFIAPNAAKQVFLCRISTYRNPTFPSRRVWKTSD